MSAVQNEDILQDFPYCNEYDEIGNCETSSQLLRVNYMSDSKFSAFCSSYFL